MLLNVIQIKIGQTEPNYESKNPYHDECLETVRTETNLDHFDDLFPHTNEQLNLQQIAIEKVILKKVTFSLPENFSSVAMLSKEKTRTGTYI